MIKQRIQIFDTTLRDGQQCPGAGMAFEKNIEYAKLAAKVGVDVLEAGFPAASQTDFMIVNTIAKEISGETSAPIIAALCQLRPQQIDITLKALAPAMPYHRARLHTYLPVDPELMRASLGDYAQKKLAIIEDVYTMVKQAAAAGVAVEFSPEGYSRMGKHFDFVTDVIRAAIEGGATIINCPDTVGGACKYQGENYFVKHMQQHAAIFAKAFPEKNIIWSAHCHNDFGLALENTMEAIFHGPATQIEGCFNGIGERAGNVSLEQCIMVIKHFGELITGNKTYFTDINTEYLQPISDFVARHMLQRQPHWPITGNNAAKHTSGGHTNAIIKNPLVYQPFDPKDIGNEISFVFGPLSGGNHAKTVIENLGYHCGENEKASIAQYIKDYYADRRKGITDQELLQAYFHYRKPIDAKAFEYAKTGGMAKLIIKGKFFHHENHVVTEHESYDSALAILHKAVTAYMPHLYIENYQSQSGSEGIDASSVSKITVRYGPHIYTGRGEDQDIEISALKALVDAVNQAYIRQYYQSEEQTNAA